MTTAYDKQPGGNHYKRCKIQPTQYIIENGLGFCEGNVVKYVTRHKFKGGRVDIEKAIHYLQILLEHEYPESGTLSQQLGQDSLRGDASGKRHVVSVRGKQYDFANISIPHPQ